MSILLTQARKEELVQLMKKDSRLTQLWKDYCARVARYSGTPELIPMYERTKWWFYVWDRIGDAAFVYAMSGDKKAGEYVHACVMDICVKKTDADWNGPWFRRVSDPPVANLETAHISCAVCAAYDLCPDLFTEEEKEIILNRLRTLALPAGRRFVDMPRHFSNWKIIMFNGYATTACILGDKDEIAHAVEFFKFAVQAFNTDSYGEGVQYSNYAAFHLLHTYEVLTAYDESLREELDSSFAVNMIRWYAASFMHMKPMNDLKWGDKAYPRNLNFGDSSAIFRPSGDVLMHVAKRFSHSREKEAGLAMWLFETTYKEDLEPYDISTFGLFNQYHYYTFINYVSKDVVKPLSPKEAEMPLINTFETGTTVYRDRWEEPNLILGIQGGYQTNRVTGHRHQDQNSFILTYKKERMLVDPGHCCYRLECLKFSRKDISHNTWTFEKENGEILHQKEVRSFFSGGDGLQEPMNILERCEKVDNLFIVQSDCANVYGQDIIKAQRTWLVLGGNMIFVVDRIKSNIPVKPVSHFLINNRGEQTDDRIFYGKRVVFRRNGVGMKFLPLAVNGQELEMTMNWGYMHDYYHPEPNRLGQGIEGSALIYDYKPTDYTTDYVGVYAIILDSDKDIKRWHLRNVEENVYYIEPKEKTGGFQLSVNKDGSLTATDVYQNKNYEIK